MAPTLKICLIQFQPRPLSPEANFTTASTKIRDAAAAGCHLAVLPEYHLTSWVPSDPGFAASCLNAEAYLPRYQSLATDLNIHIVPGTILTQRHSSPGSASSSELHNMAYLLAAGTGKILASYQKRNLWHPERGILTPGVKSPHTAFDLPIPGTDVNVRAGLLICWDLAFPEAFRELAVRGGAEIVIVPAWWHITEVDPAVKKLNPDSEAVFLDGVAVARAFENTCAVAISNAFGRSQAVMPIVGRLGVLGIEEEGEVVCEVDFETLRVAEETYKVRKDVSQEGWYGRQRS